MSKLSKNAQSGLSNMRRSLDAASIYLNPVWKDGKFVDLVKFGATTGPVSFNPETTYREREFNGASRTPMMGNQVLETVSVTATATLAELTTALIQKTIKGDIEDLGDGRKRHIPRVLLSEEDYIDKVLIVNWLPDGDWWGIMMYNVLFTSPFAVESEDNGDFSMEVTMTAHNDPNDPDAANKIPYEIISSKSMNPVQGELQENGPTTEPEVPGRTIIEVFNEARDETIPFITQTIEDDSLPVGQTIIDQYGENGIIEKTFEITVWSDGYREERLISENVVKEPINEVVRIGSGVETPEETAIDRAMKHLELLEIVYEDGQPIYDHIDSIDGTGYQYLIVEDPETEEPYIVRTGDEGVLLPAEPYGEFVLLYSLYDKDSYDEDNFYVLIPEGDGSKAFHVEGVTLPYPFP